MWAGAGLAAVFIYDIFDRLQMLESNAKVLPRAVMIAVIFIGVLNAAKCSITSITNNRVWSAENPLQTGHNAQYTYKLLYNIHQTRLKHLPVI